MTNSQQLESEVIYQGQFGEFTITPKDRQGVIIYRAGLLVAALSFACGCFLSLGMDNTLTILNLTSWFYGIFIVSLGISLITIHIYLIPLHRLLQSFWLIGTVASVVLALQNGKPLALLIVEQPLSLFGIGFVFAALTGIYFKEAFCFNRLETKLLTPLIPVLILGHIAGILPLQVEQILLSSWAILFLVFALRKVSQEIPSDIGDKSVFAYLKQQKNAQSA